MATQTSTSIDYGALEIDQCSHREALLTFAGAATAKKGTILAVDSSTLKYVLFVKGGSSNGNGIPKAVLGYEVVATGASDIKVSAIVEGKLNKKRLVIHANGDDSAVDVAVLDQLRDYGIVAVNVEQAGGALYTDEDS